MAVLRVGALPDEPLAAAARFHADILPRALAALAGGENMVIVFDAADHTHRDWRLAIVRGLARQYAPLRVNAVAGGADDAIEAGLRYLAQAPGVTGQLLPVDGTGAGPMLYQQG
ncbi:hypothetical protein HNO88_000678 [Novosphingobium chloroacetimidivorans]|uniref:Short chain dehydrogenase-like proteobacteria domain-containing protein n=1 Tax=Novosphingobium chloroacetimidivorans TaxID=1428314 RepID=A0A7W7K7L7_9SPHN|nr:hypothetical protein [Novosphingobium chloroacetimidivorans]MBB4857371.1 hypothetical protein [Novosphingobium chloroacetimidivorans]